jgi:hypothetical protein
LLRRINTMYAAVSIERAEPRMKNSVLSWVDLSRRKEDLPEPILKNIESKAANDLAKVKIEDAIQPRNVMSAMYVLAGVVILFCFYSFFTTKSFGASVQRVLMPLSGAAAPTATQLRILFDPGVDNGSRPAPIPAGSNISIKATIVRGRPDQVMAYVQQDGSDYEEPHPLSGTSVPTEFSLTLPQRQKSFEIRFVADDFRSERYLVPVTPAPMVTDYQLRYTPPAYTGDEPFTATTPDIDGLEGTKVEIEATTNVPVDPRQARIELRLDKVDSTVDMSLVEGAGSKIVGSFLLTDDGSYRVTFKDREGRGPEFAPYYNVRVRRDLTPVVEFADPSEPEAELAAGRPLVIRARVSDDLGLRRTRLVVLKKDAPETIVDREQGRPGQMLGRAIDLEESFDPAKLGAMAGDIVEYWIEAEDTKLPVANVVSTRGDRRTVRIVPPAPAEEGQSTDKPDEPPEESATAQKGDEPGKPDASEVADQPTKESGEEDSSAAGQPTDTAQAREGGQGESAGSGGESPDKNGDSAAGNSSDNLSDADKRDLDRLREYFKETPEKDGEAPEGPSDASDSKSNDTPKDGTSPQKGPSEPTPEESSPEKRTEGESRESSTDEGSTAREGQDGSEQGERSGQQPTESDDQGESASGDGDRQQGDGEEKESGSPMDGAVEQGDRNRQKDGTSESTGEKAQQGSRTNSKQQDSKQEGSQQPSGENGSSPTKEKPTGAPAPEGEGESGEKESKRSHKHGQDESSAAPAGNSSGQSQQGESGSQGESASGSPTKTEGREGSGKGDQKGAGESNAQGERPAGDPGPGQKGSAKNKPNGEESTGSEGESSPGQADGTSNETEEGSAPSDSDSPNDDTPGKGKGNQGQQRGEPNANQGSEGEGEPGSESDGEAKGSGKATESGKNPPSPQGGSSRPATGGQDGQPPDGDGSVLDHSGDAANRDDLNQGSNLVLRELEEELKKKKVDPNLLKEMGWTEEDARNFYDKLRSAQPKDESSPLAGPSRESFGQGTDLRRSSGRAAGKQKDAMGDLYSGRRAPVPPDVRRRFEAYMRSLSDVKSSEGAGPSKPTGSEK